MSFRERSLLTSHNYMLNNFFHYAERFLIFVLDRSHFQAGDIHRRSLSLVVRLAWPVIFAILNVPVQVSHAFAPRVLSQFQLDIPRVFSTKRQGVVVASVWSIQVSLQCVECELPIRFVFFDGRTTPPIKNPVRNVLASIIKTSICVISRSLHW